MRPGSRSWPGPGRREMSAGSPRPCRFACPGRARKTGAAYALRWEASGPAGGLFPVLDADLSLIRADAGRTRLAIIACYRSGTLSVQLDRMLLSRMARTTLWSLLDSLVREMTRPDRASARIPPRSAPPAGEAPCEGRATVRSA